MRKNKIRQCIAVMLSIAVVWAMSSVGTDAVPNDEQEMIQLNKTAQPLLDNQWKIQLSIDGKDYKTTTDVVLAVDVSNSMRYDMSGESTNGESRMNYVKAAAQKFVDRLADENGLNRIAIVTFGKTATQMVGFTHDKQVLNTAVSRMTTKNEGTNIQSGLVAAKNLLKQSNANNKSIVLLGDGQPTYVYQIQSSTGITLNEQNGKHTVRFADDYTLNFQYSSISGDGTANSRNRYYLPCKNCKRYINVIWDFGRQTAYEAKTLKNEGIQIYAIAFGADDNGEKVLKEVSSNTPTDNSFYTVIPSETPKDSVRELLDDTFYSIEAKIMSAAQNGIVTDPMGEMFDLVGNGENIEVSQGSVTLSADGRMIQWAVGTVEDGKTATMTYTVSLKSQAEPDTLYPTNGRTVFRYQNHLDEVVEKDFPIPQVSIAGGSLTIEKTGDPKSNESSVFVITDENGNMVQAVIHGTGECTVFGLKSGMRYTVRELTDWSWKYQLNGASEKHLRIGTNSEQNKVQFENKGKVNILSDESYAENRFTAYEGA